jgi:hypothetical protein
MSTCVQDVYRDVQRQISEIENVDIESSSHEEPSSSNEEPPTDEPSFEE